MGKEGEERKGNKGGWKSKKKLRKINHRQMRGKNCVCNQVDR